MTIDVEAPASSSVRLLARSSFAIADAELARNTQVDLLERQPLEIVSERFMSRIRRIIERGSQDLTPRT